MANCKTGSRLSTSADSNLAEQRSASIDLLASLKTSSVPSAEMPPTLRIETAEPMVDIDGVPLVIRLLAKDLLSSGGDSIPRDSDVRTLPSSVFERMVAGMRGLFEPMGDLSSQPIVMVELTWSDQSLVWSRVRPNTAVLRVGSLELDLVDRTVKRGSRPIDLRPREFQLLSYMMRRSDKLLTRETILREVWHYKFVPETNLVDVHMGKLRRKVDGSDEAPMIRTVRGEGFVLSAGSSGMVCPRQIRNPI
jgi:DNA-binding winged helix-turn-helix (wHTH) protein